MFYVVYLIDIDDFIVIPENWLRDNDIYSERFINYSLNSSQTHLCYWSSHVDAITQNGQPNSEYPPNFNAVIKNSFPCAEGCYKCRVVRGLRNYKKAEEYREGRRERLPALYYANRLQENPIPNLSSIEPEANVQLDNIALGHINEVNAEEQEVVIPINHLNPIVLLERVFQENQAFEAEYEVDGGAANPFGEDAFADPLDLVYGEEEPAIKYEIILEQDDLDEVDGILNENSGNECEPMDSNAGTNMDTVEQFAVDDVTANGTDQIGINNVFVHPSHMDMDIKIEVNDDATADQRITHQKVASSSGVWDIDLNDNADGATQYDRESITTANVPDHNETSNEVNDMDIENEILDNMGSAQENGEHGPSLAIIIDQNETNNAVEPTFSDGWTKAAANHDESDDDVLYIEPTSSWPAPKTFEIADFVKKENDRFSGDLPFSQRSKSGKSWREYIIGFDRVIKVPQTNVNTCIKFSTYPFASELIYDQKLVHAMVVLCSTKRELQLGKVNRDVVEFIRHLLCVRVKGDSERLAKLPDYIQDILRQKRQQ